MDLPGAGHAGGLPDVAGFLLLKWWSDPLLVSWFGPRTPSSEMLFFW
jgi:hypothetical protein